MPKKINVKEDLHAIIESMNPTEKRYFKLFIKNSQDQNKAYTLIFDLINNSTEHTSNIDIELHLKEHNVKIDIPKAKQYLYKVILKSLIYYYSDEDDYVENKFRLLELKILSKKNLNHIHQRKLKLLQKHFIKNNNTLMTIESFSIIKTSILNRGIAEYSVEKIENILENEKKHIEDLYIESELKSVLVKLHRLISSEGVMPIENIKEAYQKLEQSEIFTKDISDSTTIAKLLKWHSLGFIKLKLAKFEESFTNFKNYVKTLDKYWRILDPEKFNYCVGLANCTSSLMSLKKYDEANLYNQKLKTINSDSMTVNLMATEFYFSNQIIYKIEKQDFKDFISLTEDAFSWMKVKSAHIPKEDTFKFINYYSMGLILQKKYSDALDYLNSIFFEPKIQVYSDDSIVAKILLIICHFNLQNFPIVISTSRSLARQLHNVNLKNTAEYFFAKKIIEAASKSQKNPKKSKQLLIQSADLNIPHHTFNFNLINHFN
jgi:hypothetical protein